MIGYFIEGPSNLSIASGVYCGKIELGIRKNNLEKDFGVWATLKMNFSGNRGLA